MIKFLTLVAVFVFSQMTLANINCELTKVNFGRNKAPKVLNVKILKDTSSVGVDLRNIVNSSTEVTSDKLSIKYETITHITKTVLNVQTFKSDPDLSPEFEMHAQTENSQKYTGTAIIQGYFYNVKCDRNNTVLDKEDDKVEELINNPSPSDD